MGTTLMARKNLLTGLTEKKLTAVNSGEPEPPKALPLAFSGRGAFGAVTRTIDALAVRADVARDLEARLAAGETIAELDTRAIDRSFITDRMQSDDESYRLLRAAIEAEGQASPILVRPHPTAEGRYQVAFGHRRLRVASELGRSVRCIVKPLTDRELVIAQGQENSARADLSFIERSRFAQALEEAGYDRPTIMTALSVDKTVLSRMISVVNALPAKLIAAVGPAPGAGRDRWLDIVQGWTESKAAAMDALLADTAFGSANSDERFAMLHQMLTQPLPVARPDKGDRPISANRPTQRTTRYWAPKGGERVAKIVMDPEAFTLTIDKTIAPDFGEFIMARLARLYAEYAAKADTSVKPLPIHHSLIR
jgi:ParB family transcriptional regulator, chromosome partitioning protein